LGTGVGIVKEVLGWSALAVVLVLLVPPFLCMPLTMDTVFYDICARHVLRGGALERDFLYLVFPGMTWALAAVRATVGESSVAARAADLAVVAAIIALLLRWLRVAGLSRAACAWSAVFLSAFYLTTTEWVQVQPDTWMLLPALGALHLRRRQVAALTAQVRTGRQAAVWGLVEGLLWGTACLFKPFVVLPGPLTWLAAAALIRQSRPGAARRLVPDAAGLLVGGLLMGAAWQGWLVRRGTWHDYWHNSAEFCGEFYDRLPPWTERPLPVILRLLPWGLLHLAAVLIALVALVRALDRRRGPATAALAGESLLSACYLGWLVQANFLQSQFHYHVVPTVFLALTLLAGWLGRRAQPLWGWAALAVFCAVGVALQPAVAPARLALWADCWRRGNSPEMMDRLHLYPTSPTWVDLSRVADYLREQGVHDRDVLCFDLSTTPLQTELDIRPATRHVYPSMTLFFFPKHAAAVREELMAGPQRYVVIDLVALNLAPDAPLDLPRRWPYTGRVVFRSGRYCVLQTDG
jgi:hypothetical protein